MAAEDGLSNVKIEYEHLIKENLKICHDEMKKQLDDEIKVYKVKSQKLREKI